MRRDVTLDGANSGRWCHDCLGGACRDGKCQAVEVATVGSAPPLSRVVASADHLFVFSATNVPGSARDIWRIAKAGGPAEPYVAMKRLATMAVLGDTLYFVVTDLPNDGTPSTTVYGGLYSCPLVGPPPCTPTLVVPARNPTTVIVDRGRVFYTYEAAGVMA